MNIKPTSASIDIQLLKTAPLSPSRQEPPKPVIAPQSFKPESGLMDLASSDFLQSIEHSIDVSSAKKILKRSESLKSLSPSSLPSLPKVESSSSEFSGYETIKSTQQMLQGLSDLSGHQEIQELTGKVVQPLETLDSALSTHEAFKKMWDKPNIENLADLSLSFKKTVESMVDTIETVPGGKLLVKALTHLVEGIAPGLKTADLGNGFVELMLSIKQAAHDPSMKNIANAVLETVQFTGSIGLATGIPLVAQIGKGIVAGVDLVQGMMNIDYSGLAKKASSTLASLSSWVGIGSHS